MKVFGFCIPCVVFGHDYAFASHGYTLTLYRCTRCGDPHYKTRTAE